MPDTPFEPKTGNPAGIHLRPAVREDAPAVIELICALAAFEKLDPPDAAAQERLIADGFGERPRFHVLLAEVDDAPGPVGYAFTFETYSTFLARPTLYLEDLFVLPDYRKRGIGKALLWACVKMAMDGNCGRMEWVCLDWNTNAQAVYERMGAQRMTEWLPYRLPRDTMYAFLEDNT